MKSSGQFMFCDMFRASIVSILFVERIMYLHCELVIFLDNK